MSDPTASSGVVEADVPHDRIHHVGRRQGFSPYPKYKPSGVEWLKNVPEHWAVPRLKDVVLRIDRKSGTTDDRPYIGLDAIESWTGRLLPDRVAYGGYGFSSRFEAGDTLYGKLRPYLAKAYHANHTGCCSSELLVLRATRRIASDFLLYALVVPGFVDAVCSSTFGARMPRADWSWIGSRRVPLPGFVEQHAIVRYLDRETAKIDALIARNEALIKHLEEQRTALISRTVTRGLPPAESRKAGIDPNPKLKPSGVEWLGDVPEHWEVAPVKRHCRIVNGGTPASADPTFWNGSVRWITPEDLGGAKSRTVSSTRRTLSRRGYANCGAQVVPARSVVLSTRAPIGHVAIMAKPSCANQGCRSLVPNRSVVNPVFLYYVIRSQRAVLKSLGKGTTFLELSTIDVGGFPVAFPFLDEQRAIAAYLDRETAKIDKATTLAQTGADLLREYRSRLISDVVTGRVDVRCLGGTPRKPQYEPVRGRGVR